VDDVARQGWSNVLEQAAAEGGLVERKARRSTVADELCQAVAHPGMGSGPPVRGHTPALQDADLTDNLGHTLRPVGPWL
jgi:hypothetical protein